MTYQPFTIRKPSHRFLNAAGVTVALGQMRGDVLFLNRLELGAVVEKSFAVGSCGLALTMGGDTMPGAWRFTFDGVPVPATVEAVTVQREALPVIFRAERSGEFKGDVTAVFPTLAGTSRHDFTIYAHVGQHGTGSFDWYRGTRPATPAEYAPLYRELRGIYESSPPGDCEPVTLAIARRFTSAHDKARRLDAR